jgi:hypothetical protein
MKRSIEDWRPPSLCSLEGWGAALAIGGATIAGAAISSSAAESAANTQASAAENAQGISQAEFNTITGQEQPFMQGGYGALGQLEYGLGINGTVPAAPGTSSNGYQTSTNGAPFTIGPGSTAGNSGFGALNAPFTAATMQQYSPAYQFQLQQGEQGTLNADTSSNGALSGAAQKDLTSFNQNYANTAFNNAFNQYQTQQSNIYSRLAGIAGLGQTAASNTGSQGTQLAGQEAQSATNIGTAQAAGTVGAANAITGGLSSLSALPWLYNAASAAPDSAAISSTADAYGASAAQEAAAGGI